ncbi:uncharacterized protein A4U43_C07F4530 [Asparagus officinalis]|uniref:TF-B3 domain-containing protein n=1 Tax=Asparagus officinalis TaxID=4686 RepID=A0A5P1E9C2_ASPOF|nr:uncharacterized protein A4U43_C07F4530 [Asparagus officinalis]
MENEMIPPCFKKHLGKSIMQRSVLRSSAVRKWEIKMGIVDEQNFFQDGWEHFISNNPINLGDFLVLFYDVDVVEAAEDGGERGRGDGRSRDSGGRLGWSEVASLWQWMEEAMASVGVSESGRGSEVAGRAQAVKGLR